MTRSATERQRWTLTQLRERRDAIIATAERNGAFDVRVFGSMARGDSQPNSDIDFLVSFRHGSSIFDQVRLWLDAGVAWL